MQRPCAQCGKPFEAERATATFCGATCRQRSRRGTKPAAPALAEVRPLRTPDPKPAVPLVPSSLYDTCAGELGESASTSLGRAALLIARRLDDGLDTSGAAVAALSKELSRLMDLARPAEQAAAEDDPIAYLQRRADERRNRVG